MFGVSRICIFWQGRWFYFQFFLSITWWCGPPDVPSGPSISRWYWHVCSSMHSTPTTSSRRQYFLGERKILSFIKISLIADWKLLGAIWSLIDTEYVFDTFFLKWQRQLRRRTNPNNPILITLVLQDFGSFEGFWGWNGSELQKCKSNSINISFAFLLEKIQVFDILWFLGGPVV